MLSQQFHCRLAVGFHPERKHILVESKFRIMNRRTALLPCAESNKTTFGLL